MINRIKNNFKVLKKCFLGYCATMFPLLEVVTIFIPLEDFGVNSRQSKILLLIVLLCIGIVFAVISIFLRRKKQVFGDTSKGCTICYGNLMKIAFDNREKKEKIIVIHVNRCFDLSCEDNLIRESSIHGQFPDIILSYQQVVNLCQGYFFFSNTHSINFLILQKICTFHLCCISPYACILLDTLSIYYSPNK